MSTRHPLTTGYAAKSALTLLTLAIWSAWAGPTQSPSPTPQEIGAVCEFVAAIDKHEAPEYFLRRGHLDVNNDGQAERVTQGNSGTMGGDALEFTTSDGLPLQIEQHGFEGKDYGSHGEALLPYGHQLYLAHFSTEDLRYPIYLSYVTPQNTEYVVCEFANSVSEEVGSPSEDFGSCKTWLANPPEALPFAEPQGLTQEAIGRPETYARNSAEVDFDNDGTQETLVALEYASGAGRGCGFNYFDILAPGKAALDPSAKHDLLMHLQGVDLKGRYPGTCAGNMARWFAVNGVTYLENKYPGDAPRNRQQEFHSISYIQDGEPRTACTYRFAVKTSVSRYVERGVQE